MCNQLFDCMVCFICVWALFYMTVARHAITPQQQQQQMQAAAAAAAAQGGAGGDTTLPSKPTINRQGDSTRTVYRMQSVMQHTAGFDANTLRKLLSKNAKVKFHHWKAD